ncbi:hypothetical protein HU200_041554 [Digitaria exilis]|uniref:F-box domain-containing protein n=1 Tax=Digitaria exilis TaxID=1010633 RepID=A0A835B661_9POAL|nr:hypothetical protein HU200_041554 [Digitaria exilis]
MPPVRRARAHPAAGPYSTDGWLSRRRRRHHRGVANVTSNLPDDALFEIFSRVSSAADAARCAATCRRWGRVVAARAAAISRALPSDRRRFLPHLALGFIYQQRKENGLRFVPTASAAASPLHLGGGTPLDARLLDERGACLFDHARPVASRNGRLVLELRRADGLTLSVWNPMTGEVSVLPTLSAPKDSPGDYACAILTGDDLDTPPSSSTADLFRLLLMYNRRGSTMLRSYSSDTRRWGDERDKPGDMIRSRVLGRLGPAVVLRGMAYWHTRHGALGVLLDAASSPSPDDDVCFLTYKGGYCKLDEHVLAVSPDGKTLRFVEIRFTNATQVPVITFSTSLLKDPTTRAPPAVSTMLRSTNTFTCLGSKLQGRAGTICCGSVKRVARSSSLFWTNPAAAHVTSSRSTSPRDHWRSWPMECAATRAKTSVAMRWTVPHFLRG